MSEIQVAAMLEEGLRTIVREEITAALRTFTAHGATQTSISGHVPAPTPLNGFDPYSLVPYVEHVLREAGGGPLHARVIAEQVYLLGFQHRWPPEAPRPARTDDQLAGGSEPAP